MGWSDIQNLCIYYAKKHKKVLKNACTFLKVIGLFINKVSIMKLLIISSVYMDSTEFLTLDIEN